MSRQRITSILAGGILLIAGAANVAIADDHASGVTGSVAKSSGTTITSEDNADDGSWTRANWNSAGGGEGGVSNKSGPNTTVSEDTGENITAVQACRSELPPRAMTCSGWNNWH